MNSHSIVLALSNKEIATFVNQLVHIGKVLGEGFQPLEAKAMGRLTKLHAKRQAVVPEIVRVANQFGIESHSVPLAAMKEQLDAAARIQPLVKQTEALLKVLTDMLLSYQSAGWKGAAANYAALQAEAKSNAVLAAALLP